MEPSAGYLGFVRTNIGICPLNFPTHMEQAVVRSFSKNVVEEILEGFLEFFKRNFFCFSRILSISWCFENVSCQSLNKLYENILLKCRHYNLCSANAVISITLSWQSLSCIIQRSEFFSSRPFIDHTQFRRHTNNITWLTFPFLDENSRIECGTDTAEHQLTVAGRMAREPPHKLINYRILRIHINLMTTSTFPLPLAPFASCLAWEPHNFR